jgi:hypothetical protein
VSGAKAFTERILTGGRRAVDEENFHYTRSRIP